MAGTKDGPARVACTTPGCRREARMAVLTRRPRRARLESVVCFDDREAMRGAAPYCKPCGLVLVTDLVRTLVEDNPPDLGAVRASARPRIPA